MIRAPPEWHQPDSRTLDEPGHRLGRLDVICRVAPTWPHSGVPELYGNLKSELGRLPVR